MTKTLDKKLTLADLIAKKAEKEAKQNRTEDVYIESLGGHITIQNPPRSVIYKAIDMMGDSAEDNVYANAYLIYHSVKMFQEKELHDAYEVKDPVEIVGKLLEPVEINEVATKIMTLAGFAKPEDVEKNLKK
jgi:hypothetical protein